MTDMSKNAPDKDMQEVGHWGQAVALSFRFLLVGAAAVALGWLLSNIRQVPPDSQAVILRLGAVARVQGPGLLIAWPKPIEQVVLVPASARQIQFAIGRFTESQPPSSATDVYGYDLSDTPRLNSGFLLSGDSSVVHLEARVFYQITDAQSYMIAEGHIAVALQRKYSGPLSVMVMAFLGIPLALSFGRRGTVIALCSAVAVSLAYWGVSGGFQQLGNHGLLPPPVAGWAPPVIFAAAGTYFLARIRT